MEQPPRIFGGNQPQFNDAGVLESTTASSFMSTVFTWMVAGLGVTAAAAYYAAASELYMTLMQGMGFWLVTLAPFAFLLVMNFGLQRLSVTSWHCAFWRLRAPWGSAWAACFTCTRSAV